MRRWLFVSGLCLLAALIAPSAAGAKSVDFVVGSGSTVFFSSFETNLTSGPSGENPTGHVVADGFGEHFESSSITCLSVSGNTATYVDTLKPNIFGFTYGKATAVDNGPANSGLDTLAA